MPTPSADERQIAASVPMNRLLESLGFVVNERTKRSPCLLHSGSNPTAFSWTESGLFRCHSCGRGGDRIALVREVKQCSFREAVAYLAALAGVEYRSDGLSRAEVEEAQRKRQSLRNDAETLLSVEHLTWRKAQDVVLQLEVIRRCAGRRLNALNSGAGERWPGEGEFAWEALAEVYRQMPRAVAAYNVISFAPHKDRLTFALDAQARDRLTEEASERGYVADESGYRFEVQL